VENRLRSCVVYIVTPTTWGTHATDSQARYSIFRDH
jgi:hypothetical protein